MRTLLVVLVVCSAVPLRAQTTANISVINHVKSTRGTLLEGSGPMNSTQWFISGQVTRLDLNNSSSNFSTAEDDVIYSYGSTLEDTNNTKWMFKQLPDGAMKILLRGAQRDDEERRITDTSYTSWTVVDHPGGSSLSRAQDILKERIKDSQNNVLSQETFVHNPRQDSSQSERSKSDVEVEDRGLQWLLDHLEDIVPDNSLCRNHTALFLKELQNLTLWAVSMVDATSKIPEGILQGNIRDLGSFDECVAVRAEQVFQGQYCLAHLQLETSTHQSALEGLLDVMTAGRRSLEITRNRQGNFLPYFALFEWAVCVPSTCTAQDVQTALRSLSDNLHIDLRVNITVDPNNCQVEGPLRLQPRDFGMLVVILVIVLLLAAGTLYDLKLKLLGPKDVKVKSNHVLVSFSLFRNMKRLLDTSSTPGSLSSVEGIRFLTILWVIATHKVFSMSREPWTNKTHLLQMAEPVWKMPLQNNMLNVDTFFVVGGMLRCYNMLRDMEQGSFKCFCGFIQRYLRLTPAYAVVIGIWATLLVHLGSGPTWHRNIVLNSEHCQLHWSLNILYVNNYIDGHDMCMPHTWYLAADMQMFILAPIIVYPMWRFGWLGRILLLLAVGASVAVLFVIIFLYKFLGVQSAGFHDTMLQDYTIYVYLPTHMRLSSYLVGLALGYTFYRLDDRPEFSLSKMKVFVGWSASLLTLAGVMFGPYSLMVPGAPYRPLEQGLYGCLHRLSWALGVAWVIFACHKGYGGPVNALLSLPVLRPLARLTYCIYLVHMAVILVGTARLRTALYMDDFYVVHSLVADAVISIVLAAVLYLSVEMPFVTIARKILPRQTKA